jgi:hypothetical protein
MSHHPCPAGKVLSVFLLVFSISAVSCAEPDQITTEYRTDFSKSLLDWLDPVPQGYSLDYGSLRVAAPKNQVLWLRQRLPDNVEVELDAVALDHEERRATGDLKFVLYGDGSQPQLGKRANYENTGYIVVIGGWGNRSSMIAKSTEAMTKGGLRTLHPPGRHYDEHSTDVLKDTRDTTCGAELIPPVVEPNRIYRIRIAKAQSQVTIAVDGQPYLTWTDPSGRGPEQRGHFGIVGWQSTYFVDNLTIRPL